MFNKLALIIVFSFVITINVSAEEASNWYDGIALTPGITYRSIDLEVAEPTNLSTKGILTKNEEFSYLLFLASSYKYIKDYNFGYYFEYGYSPFELDRQTNDLDSTSSYDRGTYASGHYFYVTPTLFYNFGDRFIHKTGSNLKIGFGMGLGYLKAKGNIVFDQISSQEVHNFDISGIGLAYTLFIDYRYNNWVFRIINNGPELKNNNNLYAIYDEIVSVGYSFIF
ncbi:MAG: hypothetical protein OEZ33_03305 [Gammaproteobacteria bacterium]|nr:hypothetical protein [Gammaproteobacteria bacterium]MDH5777215.1 hypothetical protein [Gammaproteobacteria bacterium]